jgi:ABC-2 type transport system permease protein
MPIFDQGYQHWRGSLSGHTWRWLTIARQGTRVQIKGRNIKVLMFLAWLPAVALVSFLAVWGLVEGKTEGLLLFLRNMGLPADVLADPKAYRSIVWTLAYSFFFKTEIFFIMLLVVIAGPGLISSDLRFNALPLYLSRPLNRIDYFLGKLGVIGLLVASVAVGPAVLAYFVGLCFSLDPGVIKDTWKVLLASIGYGLVTTVSAGMLMLALSSMSRRSLYVGIAWAGLWIISSSVGNSLSAVHRETLRDDIYVEKMKAWDAEHPAPAGQRMPAPNDFRQRPGMRPRRPAAFGPANNDPWQQARTKAMLEARAAAREQQSEELRKDWRPLFSYVANLDRIADQLLDTDAAWLSIGKAVVRSQQMAAGLAPGNDVPDFSDAMDERFLADQMVPQYPWEWSAGVLAALLGLSIWILTRRVKSLDRLK